VWHVLEFTSTLTSTLPVAACPNSRLLRFGLQVVEEGLVQALMRSRHRIRLAVICPVIIQQTAAVFDYCPPYSIDPVFFLLFSISDEEHALCVRADLKRTWLIDCVLSPLDGQALVDINAASGH